MVQQNFQNVMVCSKFAKTPPFKKKCDAQPFPIVTESIVNVGHIAGRNEL